MNRILIVFLLSMLMLPLSQASMFNEFVVSDEKATFIDGKDHVVSPDVDNNTLDHFYVLNERAAAMSAMAVTADGTQYQAQISPKALALFEQAIAVFDSQELSHSLFYHEHQGPLLAPKNPINQIPYVVIGDDNRIQIMDTLIRPHVYNGRIDTGCTGTLIDTKHVLTAGHCVSDGEGHWYSALDFTVAQNGEVKPWGTTKWQKVLTTTAWHTSGDYHFDFAMIVLEEAPHHGHAGWGIYREGIHSVAGYPADKLWRTMWTDSGEIVSSTYRLCYTLDTAAGQSGSGIKDEAGYVRGVHTTGSSSQNCGTRLTSTVFTLLQSWIAANP
ncbi:trypsin-like serine protease [uncultured Shewanella sp.]|uniref:trypsin-like serine peptidase n=1 Tax=uncultured Shewanella sp. TaxID=173975 RepID=UPI00262F5D03|nr:trypsin-like serine protease [uncultured Shewanella sp.]